jgi:hypothetical protein
VPRFASREEYEQWKASGSPPAPDVPVPQPVTARAAPEASAQGSMPGWAWLFIGACALIPILTLGGAIPGALGGGCAAGCASIAKNTKQTVGTRVALCAAVTGGAWLLFIVFIALLARA